MEDFRTVGSISSLPAFSYKFQYASPSGDDSDYGNFLTVGFLSFPRTLLSDLLILSLILFNTAPRWGERAVILLARETYHLSGK